MRATGITRPLDELGRIVVPKELRRTFEINEGEKVDISYSGDQIVIKHHVENRIAVVRKLDSLGRVVIPIELRRMFEINERDVMEFFVGENEIIIKKYQAFGKCAVTGDILKENQVYAGITLSPAGKAMLLSALGVKQ